MFGAFGELHAAENDQHQQELQGMLVLEVGLQRLLLLIIAQLFPQEPVEEVLVASEGRCGEEAEHRGRLLEDFLVEGKDELELEEVVDGGLHVNFDKAVEHLAEVVLIEPPVQEAQQVLVDAGVLTQYFLGVLAAQMRAQEC